MLLYPLGEFNCFNAFKDILLFFVSKLAVGVDTRIGVRRLSK